MFGKGNVFFYPFWRYCCPNVGWYCDPLSGSQGAKRLKLLKLLKKWLAYKLRRFQMVFVFFKFCLTLSIQEKLKNLIFKMSIITQTLNINNLRTTSANSISLHNIKDCVEYSLKNVVAKALFVLTILEILLSKGRSVLWPAQRRTGSKGVKVSVKDQKTIENLLRFLEKVFTYGLRRFWRVFKVFWFCLSFSIPEKLKNSIFEMPVITLFTTWPSCCKTRSLWCW